MPEEKEREVVSCRINYVDTALLGFSASEQQVDEMLEDSFAWISWWRSSLLPNQLRRHSFAGLPCPWPATRWDARRQFCPSFLMDRRIKRNMSSCWKLLLASHREFPMFSCVKFTTSSKDLIPFQWARHPHQLDPIQQNPIRKFVKLTCTQTMHPDYQQTKHGSDDRKYFQQTKHGSDDRK